MVDFLLEIGTEEIPARFMESALTQLQQLSEQMLAENRIGYGKLKVYGTPRRLTLYVWEIEQQQAELVEEVKGPPKRAAFDEKGNPTKAALGFARSHGVDVADLVVRETPSGEYVFARKVLSGRPTMKVLSESLPGLITSLSFPRPMRWGTGELRFARPIRWLLALLGEEVVDFQLDGLRSDRKSYGLRFFAPEPIVIQRPEEYFQKLRQGYVIVDQEQRKKMIWEAAQETAAKVGGRVHPNEELLEEITYLLEYPVPVCGSFPERFLRLPPEVIVTPMQEHQRYFPVWDEKGKLLPRFITFCNGPVEDLDLVREGNEKVLRARLQDAEFFYEEDLKTPISDKVEKLKEIVFLEGLGTIYDKVGRLVVLSKYLGEVLGFAETEIRAAERAAFLAKADLVTSMVYEFPELQGIMGGEYARASGEPEEVCQAIREHYCPRFSGDQLPQTKLGAVVAIADKIDNLVGCFGLGLEPTGSQDPYALRRQALGICHICLHWGFDFSLGALITRAWDAYGERAQFKVSYESAKENLQEFLRIRFRNLFLEQGYDFDLVEAAIGRSCDRICLVQKRLEALAALRGTPEFEALLTAYTRAANLSRKALVTEVSPELLQEEEEKRLFAFWKELKKDLEQFLREEDFQQALVKSASLVGPIDRFFTNVMVMVEDEKLRNNRLALLKDIAVTLEQFGDLSKISKPSS
ncbi:MAG: Glycine--tRNA ligase beta subunit [Thermoanaerobacterales bacterium 50_218]|nr:MAG: Glycine--tRNA ligase beta subunit [Thermoanaerobacterales bacterium 50_218]HAA89127.1 glycine--tRNA ligase subunit beta [Peptococcaceae bacterium]